MALVGDALYVANTDAVVRVPYRDGDTAIAQAPREGRRPAGRHDQPPLDEEPDREPPTGASSTSRSARTATSARTASTRSATARPSSRSIPPPARTRLFASGLRNPNGLAWHPRHGRAVDRGQRARRARRRPRAGLPDVGEGGRVLRLAVQLLRRERRHARIAAAPRPRRQGHSRRTTRWARTSRRSASRSTTAQLLPERYRGGAFVGEHGSWNRTPQVRLQGGVRSVRERPAGRPAGRRRDRLPRRRRQARAAVRWASRWTRRARCSSPTTSATSSGESRPAAVSGVSATPARACATAARPAATIARG